MHIGGRAVLSILPYWPEECSVALPDGHDDRRRQARSDGGVVAAAATAAAGAITTAVLLLLLLPRVCGAGLRGVARMA